MPWVSLSLCRMLSGSKFRSLPWRDVVKVSPASDHHAWKSDGPSVHTPEWRFPMEHSAKPSRALTADEVFRAWSAA